MGTPRKGASRLHIALPFVGALLVVGLLVNGLRKRALTTSRPQGADDAQHHPNAHLSLGQAPSAGGAFLRLGDVELPLDTAASGIEAFVHPDDAHVTWSVEMKALAGEPSAYSGMHAQTPISSLEVRDWLSLPGAVLTGEFEKGELFFDVKGPKPVILPDTPATIYATEHSALNHHKVRFTGTKRPGFIHIDWTCQAYAAVDAAPVAVAARGEVALRSITVWTEDRQLALKEAQRLLGAKFAGIPTDQPKRTSSGFRFPVAKPSER